MTFDSCVFIDAVIGAGPFSALIAPIVREAESGHIEVQISEVSVAESCRLTRDQERAANALEDVERYLANEWMRRWPVGPAVSSYAAKLIRACRLDACDAMIAATALVHGAKKLYTRDRDTLVKRLRASQTHPVDMRDVAKLADPVFRLDDELQAKLDALEIVELKLPKADPPIKVVDAKSIKEKPEASPANTTGSEARAPKS